MPDSIQDVYNDILQDMESRRKATVMDAESEQVKYDYNGPI